MKDKTAKLQRVQRTLEGCKEMAKFNHQKEEEWNNLGSKQQAFTCRMLAEAYEFVVRLLEKDLSDEE